MTKQKYWQKLLDPRWQKKRLEILQAAEFTCEDCGETKKTLHVHHCYYTGDDPWVQGPSDAKMLKCLCEDCHPERAALEHDIKLELSRAMAAMEVDQLRDMMKSIIDITHEKEYEGTANGVTVISNDMLSILSEVRWFRVAWDRPEFREVYDEVTQSNTKWPEVKQ